MWKHEVITPEEDGDEPIEFERLATAYADLDVMELEDGKYYVEAVHSCDDETFVGHADSLEEGRQMAERWLLEQVAEMLRSLGADGIWMVRGTEFAELLYTTLPDTLGFSDFSLRPERPHPRLMLVRFPTGDGGEAGIEYF